MAGIVDENSRDVLWRLHEKELHWMQADLTVRGPMLDRNRGSKGLIQYCRHSDHPNAPAQGHPRPRDYDSSRSCFFADSMASVASQLILHPTVSHTLKLAATTVGRDKVIIISLPKANYDLPFV
jgi:hypothetical protein